MLSHRNMVAGRAAVDARFPLPAGVVPQGLPWGI
jgi:hypothetical protein